MATSDSLKKALRQKVEETVPSAKQPLSDTQYSAGFNIVARSSSTTYQDFIIPQLSHLVVPLLDSRVRISVLEIGPGPVSILEPLPDRLRRKVGKYTAFEPNNLFATALEKTLCTPSKEQPPLPRLDGSPNIHRCPFPLEDSIQSGATKRLDEKFDLILFCHSMFGLEVHFCQSSKNGRPCVAITCQWSGRSVHILHDAYNPPPIRWCGIFAYRLPIRTCGMAKRSKVLSCNPSAFFCRTELHRLHCSTSRRAGCCSDE